MSPTLSVIVVVHRMQREVARTLHSLTSEYQRGVDGSEYEVIVVENPSSEMLHKDEVESFGANFRYVRCPEPSVTPATAINLGARHARSPFLTLLIDGARILSPGVLHYSLQATRMHAEPIAATLAWHLGPKNQAESVKEGYSKTEEDRLLASAGWREDGYRLFSVAALGGSSAGGWFAPLAESNCLTISRGMFDKLGGYSEAFQTPGGGFVNLDFYRRVVTMPAGQLFILLGEGTFHQLHGGVATNRDSDRVLKAFADEYKRLRGQRFRVPRPASEPIYLGTMPEPVAKFAVGVTRPRKRWRSLRFWKRRNTTKTTDALPPADPVDASAKVISVLGMHRSGTSCLAGTLMECGVEFGEVSRRNRYNKKGNRENTRIMQLHDSILSSNGGSWNNPPEVVVWNDEQRAIRDRIINQYASQADGLWGFKDPRTLFLLDGWQEVLPEIRFVGTFRHPQSVVQSLLHRNPECFSKGSAAELWYLYNKRLMEVARETNCKLVAFDANESSLRTQFEAVATHLDLQLPPGGLRFFRPGLRHQEPHREQPLPDYVWKLYNELRQYSIDCFATLDQNEPRDLAA